MRHAPICSLLPTRSLPPAARGLTLVELLVALAIVAVLLGLGGSSLVALVEGTRAATAAQGLQSHLSLARSEAVRRGTRVSVCKSADGKACTTSGEWSQGWIVFVDADGDGLPDGPPLARAQALAAPLHLAGNQPVANYVSFIETGEPQFLSGAFQAGTLTLCGSAGRPGYSLALSRSGRVRRSSAACS